MHDVQKSNLSQVSECSSTTVHSASSAADYQHGQQAMSLFTGAVIRNGNRTEWSPIRIGNRSVRETIRD